MQAPRRTMVMRSTTPRPSGRRYRRPLATSVIAGGLLLVSTLVGPIGAAAISPKIVASPTSTVAGSQVSVVGSGFPKNQKGFVTLDSSGAGVVFRANGKGSFSTSLQVPRAASSGGHVVAARSDTQVLLATGTLIVVAATPTPTPTATPTAAPPTAAPTSAPTATSTPAPTAAPTATPVPPASGFVRASGGSLTLDGLPYRFVGMNIYNANSRDNCWYPLGYGNSAFADALAAIGPGQSAIRAWFYQGLATTAGVRDWSAFDHTIAAARAANVRIVVTLADQWGSCDSGPGAAVFKGDAWYSSGYRTAITPGNTKTYRDWVAEIVTRYRNEPTILAWQLMNEAEIKPDLASTCTPNGATILRTWAADVSGLVKSLDTNHLVSLGTLGGGQCGTQGSDYQWVHSLGTIDLCEYHDYLPGAMPGDQWNGLAVRISQCAALGKPIFVGETGQMGMSLVDRAALFGSKFDAQFAAGVDGELIWALRTEAQGGSSTSSYDVGTSDPVIGLLAGY